MSAFARGRLRSLQGLNSLQIGGLNERARAGANIAGRCHAEGRGFESHHPLLTKLRNRGFSLAGLAAAFRSQ